MDKLIVAIDGPAGSGKTTVAKKVAHDLGILYLDTGAMYRCVAYASLSDGVDPKDFSKMASVFDNNEFLFNYSSKDKLMQVFLNGIKLNKELRTKDVETAVSDVARNPDVRSRMVSLQREIALREKKIILDGRDIATVVFPDADIKIYLTASPEIRALRRLKDKNLPESELEMVKNNMIKRDKMDMERDVGPLKQAKDAILIDTSKLSFDEVINKVKEIIETKYEIPA